MAASEAQGGVQPIAYSQEQVEVQSAFASEVDFADFIFGVNTYLAVTDDQVVGFCGIADDGHVAAIYVRPDCSGQGIGTTLSAEVLILHREPTSESYYAETSIFSLPLFERIGFRQTGSQQAERWGVAFERFLVTRVTTPAE